MLEGKVQFMIKRFSQPESERVELGQEEWLELKTELSYGEALVIGAAAQTIAGQGLDVREYYLTRAAVWLVDWSLKSRDGKRLTTLDDGQLRTMREELERRKEMVAALRPELGRRIQDEIDRIEREQREATEQEDGLASGKEETPTGGSTSSPPLASSVEPSLP